MIKFVMMAVIRYIFDIRAWILYSAVESKLIVKHKIKIIIFIEAYSILKIDVAV